MLFVDWLLIFSILISSIAASRDGKSDGPSFTRNPSGQASTLNPEQAGGPSSAAFPSLSMVPVSRMRQTQTRHPIKIPGKHFIEPDFVAAVGGPSILAPGTNWHKVWTAFKAYHDQMPISMPHALSSGKGESSSKQERSALKEEDTPCVNLPFFPLYSGCYFICLSAPWQDLAGSDGLVGRPWNLYDAWI